MFYIGCCNQIDTDTHLTHSSHCTGSTLAFTVKMRSCCYHYNKAKEANKINQYKFKNLTDKTVYCKCLKAP